MSRWFILFFLTPMLEMYLLIQVGGYLGALPTIGLVMLTAVIGVFLLRRQGLATLTRGLGRAERGELPAREVAEGLLLAVAGALLLTPGFVTDATGFALLVPGLRSVLAERLLKGVTVVGSAGPGAGPGHGPGGGQPGAPPRSRSGDVIEGEYERRS